MQVRKKSDGTILAMKILKKRAIIARNQVEHTRAERKILQSLQHPFLMTLRYAFQSKEKLYFVLDYYQVRPSNCPPRIGTRTHEHAHSHGAAVGTA